MKTMTTSIMSDLEIPAYGSEEFSVWWESQYAPVESRNVKSKNIEYVEGSSLELNRIFWELEEETFAKGGEFTGK